MTDPEFSFTLHKSNSAERVEISGINLRQDGHFIAEEYDGDRHTNFLVLQVGHGCNYFSNLFRGGYTHPGLDVIKSAGELGLWLYKVHPVGTRHIKGERLYADQLDMPKGMVLVYQDKEGNVTFPEKDVVNKILIEQESGKKQIQLTRDFPWGENSVQIIYAVREVIG